VNEYVTDQVDDVEILRVDPESERQQVDRLKKFKSDRDQDAVNKRLEELRDTCKGDGNLLHPIRAALKDNATIGEVCGGTQSLHTNGFDEALALPTERAARIALRTQQILAAESGAADTVDPFAGSYFVEALTDEIEERAQLLIDRVEELGGSVNCIPFIRAEVEQSAWGYEERYRIKQDLVVGVNEYVTDTVDDVDILRVDPESERQQVERLKAFKADRDPDAVAQRLEALREVCRGEGNLLYPIRAALKDRCTIGEVCGVMRDEFGEYSEA